MNRGRTISRKRPRTPPDSGPYRLWVDVKSASVEFKTLSLGICLERCTPLSTSGALRWSVAWAWEGIAPASSKRCPLCQDPLSRRSSHNWGSFVLALPKAES